MIRKTVSLILCWSGIYVIITSVILYIGPPTHVGHFSDWRMLSLSKCQWNALHVTTGFLFSMAMIFHVFYNWRPIINYLKNTKKEFVVLTKPFILSLSITLYISIGTILNWTPMDHIIKWSKANKIAHVRNIGTPPFGPAEDAPLESIIMYMGWDVDSSITALHDEELYIDSPKISLKRIAHDNNISTGIVIDIMKKAAEHQTDIKTK